MWFMGSPSSVTGQLLASSRERIRRSWISCDDAQIAYAESIERINQSREILQRNGASHVRPSQAKDLTVFFFHTIDGEDATRNSRIEKA
jgi:hypothetical protein